ncbi:MAG: hypothetical protein ACOY3D_04930 [Candidatus Omnitrophota bacterium]
MEYRKILILLFLLLALFWIFLSLAPQIADYFDASTPKRVRPAVRGGNPASRPFNDGDIVVTK